MTFWALYIGFVAVPVLALAIDLGRFFYAKAEVGKAADAAALAGAAYVDFEYFRDTGNIRLLPEASSWASYYAAANSAYLSQFGIHPSVTGMQVDSSNQTVTVTVSANVSALFPSIVPQVVVFERGRAQIRGLTRGGP